MKNFIIIILTGIYALTGSAMPADSIRLKEKKLKTTTVVAQRRTIKTDNDKTTYDLDADPSTKTENLLEVLRKVPMVTVDGEDNIKVKGSGSFKVYVDGKPNTMMSTDPSKIMKSYPAGSVSKIEVITDPGAKYDGEGVAGIINIITNKKMYTSGWSLTPTLGLSNQENYGGFNGMVKMNRLTVSSNFIYGSGRQKKTTGHSDYVFKHSDDLHTLYSLFSAKPKYDVEIGGLEASYEIDEKNLLSISASLFCLGVRYDAHALYNMFNADGTEMYSYHLDNPHRERTYNWNIGTDYQHKFNKEGELLTFSYRFTDSPTHNRTTTIYQDITGEQYLAAGLANRKVSPENTSREHTGQIDYALPLTKTQALNSGVKMICRTNETDTKQWDCPIATLGLWTYNDGRSFHYRNTSNIYSAYMEHTANVGRLSTTIGLRYEYNAMKVKYLDGKRPQYHRDLSDLLPSVKIGYKFNESEMLKLGFNTRISRPDISMMSPYIDNTDGINQSYGNPDLNTEKAYNATLGYSNFGQKFSLNAELNTRFMTNGITAYSFMDTEKHINQTYDNFMHQRQAGINLFVNWTFTRTTTMSMNAQGGYKYYAVKQINARNDGWGGSIYLDLQQRLPWRMKASMQGYYSSRTPLLQGTQHTYRYHGISLSRNFLAEDRLSITIGAYNFIYPTATWGETTETEAYTLHSKSRHNALKIGINAKWRFGKLQATVKKTQRTIDNDDKTHVKDNKDGIGKGM